MSLHHNPKIITDGLIMNYDMANTKKSWKGMPTTNQFTLPTAAVNGFGVQNSTFTRIYSGAYGDYDIQASDYVWRYNINGGDCPYHGWDISTPAGSVVTFSFDYYISPTTVGYPSTNYLANFENAGSGVGGGAADPTPSVIGVWKRAYFSSTATATGLSRCLLYPGGCGGALASGTGFILYKNPQVEFNAPGGIPTSFVAGTRSNTQAVIDLTGNNTLTATSLTYASDNTFSFNGTTDRILATNTAFNRTTGQEISASCWIKPYRLGGQYNTIINCRTDSAYNWMLYMHTTDGALSFHGAAQNKTTVIPTVNTWVHVTNTVTSAGVSTLYVNGVSSAVVNGYTYNLTSPGQVGIGAWGTYTGESFQGLISNVQIYSRALSAGEVKQNFNALRGRYGI